MRLSILSNVNLDMLSGLLKKENEVFQTDGYGEWITYALKKDERLAAFAPECLFLLLDGNALLEGCQDIGSVKTVLDRSEQYIEKLAENYSASYLVVSTIDVRPEHIGAGDASDLAQASGAYWDTLLTGLAERQKNIHRFELQASDRRLWKKTVLFREILVYGFHSLRYESASSARGGDAACDGEAGACSQEGAGSRSG